MKRIALLGALCAAATGSLIGCQSTPIRFETGAAEIPAQSRGRLVEAEACGFQLLLLIPIEVNERATRAYTLLRAQAGRDLLTDVQVTERWFYGFVGTGYCTKLTANAYSAS